MLSLYNTKLYNTISEHTVKQAKEKPLQAVKKYFKKSVLNQAILPLVIPIHSLWKQLT